MGFTVPTAVPEKLIAGDNWRWKVAFVDFPPTDGWTLKYSIAGPTDFADVTAVVVGSEYEVNILPPSTTAALPGTYQWIARVSKGSGASEEKYVVASGVFTVVRDLSAVVAALQTHAEKMLALVEAALEGRVPADLQEYQIEGRAVTKIPVMELYQLRARYAAEVAAERRPGTVGRAVGVQFARP